MTLYQHRNQAETDLVVARAQCLHHAQAARECIALGEFPAAGRHIRHAERHEDEIPEILLRMDRLGILGIGKAVLHDFRATYGAIIDDCEKLKEGRYV